LRVPIALRTRGAICVFALATTYAFADTIFNYPGFANTTNLTLVGEAAATVTGDGTVLRLTSSTGYESSAAYSTAAVTLGSNAVFSTQFQFRFSSPGGIDPADGMTFVLAASSSGLGSTGGGIGYQGVRNSVAIEFDTYNNGPTDGDSSNHVAIDTGGNLNVLALSNVYGVSTCGFIGSTYTSAGCLSNGDLWTANVSYDGLRLSLKLLDPAKGVTFGAITNYPINVASLLGTNTAFVGFTGSTGGGSENQDILNWRFANTAVLPNAVPEPGSLLLFGIGLVSVAAATRCLGAGERVKQRQSL
jgi:Legume lectin domain/PEP-CTERM motif